MKRFAELRRGGPLPKVNRAKVAKKRARYAAHLRSPYFRALRLQAFERDGFQCTQKVPWIWRDQTVIERCPASDATRTGAGLHADHLTYARFGHELLEDLATMCRACHERRHALEFKRIRP